MEEGNPVALKCPQCGADLQPPMGETIVCSYCGSSLIFRSRSGKDGEAGTMAVRGIHLKPFSYVDSAGTGLELFRMLVPVDWKVQGGVRWLLDNPGMPAVINIQILNPQGGELFEILPNMNFTWRNPMMGFLTPVGGKYFGAEVREPVGIRQAFRQYVLPRYRSTVSGLQIVGDEVLPDLPRLARSEALTSGGAAEGGKIRIRYRWKGWQFEEDIYGVVEVFRAPIFSMFGTVEVITWFIDYLFSFRAVAGKLDAAAPLFSVMITSFKLNPHWYAAFKSIAQSLAQQQIQRIHNIGEIGKIYAQAGAAMREQNLRDWYARQEIFDRNAVEWSRAIRDMDGFYDPHREEVVELPSGYGHAWANNLGEYILTDDPNFNPNEISNLHWEPMQQS